MKHSAWFRAIWLALITLILSLTLVAQAGDPTDLLIKGLKKQFVPTVFNKDETEIITAGVVVEIQKDRLLVFRQPLEYCPISTYKNGKLSQGFRDQVDVAFADKLDGVNGFRSYPQKMLGVGDKVWISGFGISNKKNAFLAVVVTDPYDDGRYCGMLQFPYEKDHPPTPDDAMRMMSEVLASQSAQDKSAIVGPVPEAAPNPAQAGPPPPLAGDYASAGGSRILLLLDGTFVKFMGSGQVHGQYVVDGENLTLTFPSTGFTQHFKLQSGKLMDENTKQKWARTGDIPADSAAYQEIAPPPPPTDIAPIISIGQTKSQVITSLGEPQRKTAAGAKEIFFYTNLKTKVTFTNGKVSNVE